MEGTGAVQAKVREADKEVGSVVYLGGGRDSRGTEPDYNDNGRRHASLNNEAVGVLGVLMWLNTAPSKAALSAAERVQRIATGL